MVARLLWEQDAAGSSPVTSTKNRGFDRIRKPQSRDTLRPFQTQRMRIKYMKVIIFKIHMCGMSERTISRKIMIDKPFKTITKFLNLSYCSKNNISTIGNLISHIKESDNGLFNLLGEFGIENFNVENIYIKHKGYLIGLQKDKSLSDVFTYFKKNILEFDYIYVTGGASREYHGYHFIVHPKEDCHRFTPHVHVKKDNVALRYYLKTFERFKDDKHLREHDRDEKKIIIPFLKKNKKWLWKEWDMYMNEYTPPVVTESGKQYCKES